MMEKPIHAVPAAPTVPTRSEVISNMARKCDVESVSSPDARTGRLLAQVAGVLALIAAEIEPDPGRRDVHADGEIRRQLDALSEWRTEVAGLVGMAHAEVTNAEILDGLRNADAVLTGLLHSERARSEKRRRRIVELHAAIEPVINLYDREPTGFPRKSYFDRLSQVFAQAERAESFDDEGVTGGSGTDVASG